LPAKRSADHYSLSGESIVAALLYVSPCYRSNELMIPLSQIALVKIGGYVNDIKTQTG
jgi:hypothetical protein